MSYEFQTCNYLLVTIKQKCPEIYFRAFLLCDVSAGFVADQSMFKALLLQQRMHRLRKGLHQQFHKQAS